MAMLILDAFLEEWIRVDRKARGIDRHDEVRDGVWVVPPAPDNEHRRLVAELALAFMAVECGETEARVLPGANVSDREGGWEWNYRIPDVLVVRPGGFAKDCDTHWVGGPDLLVEIVSPGDDPRQKLDFYAKVNTREVLIVDRYPWALELYRPAGGRMALVGRSDPANPAVLASAVLPLTFELRTGTPRPVIVVTHTGTGQTWTA